MMDQYSFSIFGHSVTFFSVFVVCGIIIGIEMGIRRAERISVKPDTVLWFSVMGIPLGTLFARLIYVLYHFDELQDAGISYIFHMEYGGFTVIGAFLGLLIAWVLTATICHEKLLKLADTVFPSMLMVLAMERFGEQFTENGIGMEIMSEALHALPLVRQGPYEDMYCIAVNLLEGLSALIASLVTQKMEKPDGCAAGTGLVLVCSTQIVWEMIRRDDRLMLDMASLLMIVCVIILLILFLIFILYHRNTHAAVLPSLFFLISISLIGFFQFCMDGKLLPAIPLWLCVLLTSFLSCLLAIICLFVMHFQPSPTRFQLLHISKKHDMDCMF